MVKKIKLNEQPVEINGMEHLGEYGDYQLYRNSEGEIEGWRSIDLAETEKGYCRTAKDIKRIVTHATTVEGFVAHIESKEPKRKNSYNPYKDKEQTKLEVL